MSRIAFTGTDIERRRAERRSVRLDCRVEGASGRASARVSDLSITGCYVDTCVQFMHHARVTVSVNINAARILLLPGTVMAIHAGQGFAIRFDDLPDATRDCLATLVRGDAEASLG